MAEHRLRRLSLQGPSSRHLQSRCCTCADGRHHQASCKSGPLHVLLEVGAAPASMYPVVSSGMQQWPEGQVSRHASAAAQEQPARAHLHSREGTGRPG